MLENLKIGKQYDGFLFLAESIRNPPRLISHHHVELELNLVVRGAITYVMGNRRFTFGPGTLLWLYPDQEHQLVDRTDDAQNFVGVFKPSLIKAACHTTSYDGLKQNPRDRRYILHTWLDPNSFDLIRKIMESLIEDSLDADPLKQGAGFRACSSFSFEHRDPDRLNAGLHYLLLLCWRSQIRGKVFGEPVPLHPVVRRALKLLSEGAWEQDLEQLARACGASKSHLSRTFHRQIGVPLSRYRNTLRLSRFLETCRQSEQKSLTESAYAAGFGSYAQFYKVFTQAYGRGPRSSLKQSGSSAR